jgi:hypothetical protein
MGDGFWFTSADTGCWFCTIARPAGSATVPELPALLMLHKGYRFFTEDINFIRPHFKDFCWADFLALTASIALICVDDDIPVARPILKPIIGNHVISFLFFAFWNEIGNPQSEIGNE